MDEFCGRIFWVSYLFPQKYFYRIFPIMNNYLGINVYSYYLKDWERTWNTTNPDFTPCFENTFLTGISCASLWLLAPIDLLLSYHSKLKASAGSALSCAKYLLTLCLISVELVLLIRAAIQSNSETSDDAVYPVDYVIPVLRGCTYVCGSLIYDYIGKLIHQAISCRII